MADQNFRVKNGLDVGIGGTIITTTGIGSVGIGSTQPASTLVVSAPSGYTGNVIEAKLNGTSLVALKPNGTQGSIVVTSTGFNNSVLDLGGSSGIIHFSSTLWGFRTAGAYRLAFAHNEGTRIQSSDSYGWSSSTIDRPTADIDVRLFRDDAGVLAQRNAGVGQTFRIYNTYTSASEYERAYLGWNNNTFEIGVGTAGISTARSISLVGAAGSNTGDTLQPLQINQTWTTGTGIATALTVNVTDTSSSSSSKLMDLRVNGSSKFDIDKSGNLRLSSGTGGNLSFTFSQLYLGSSTDGVNVQTGKNFTTLIKGSKAYGWCNTENAYTGPGLTLFRDADGILAQRGTTGPGSGDNTKLQQVFRIYNTWTNSTDDFERGQVGWSTNVFIVGTEKGSSIGTARPMHFQTDGTTRVAITTDGYVGIGSTQPIATLDVNGDVNITGIVTATKFVGEVEIINPFLLMGA